LILQKAPIEGSRPLCQYIRRATIKEVPFDFEFGSERPILLGLEKLSLVLFFSANILKMIKE
jgi:hypothetical protein